MCKISIIIPTYNREKIIGKAIQSVLCQSFNDFELIVVDDGSTDNTKNVVTQISDSRVKYIYQEKSGACSARNKGIENACGEYIAFHDSDDIWHMDKLEKQIKIIEKTAADVVFCKLNQYEKDKFIRCLPQNIEEGFLNPVVNLFGIGTQSLMIKREVLNEVKFDETMPRFQDLELLLAILEKGYRVYCLNEGLVDYYIGNDSISKKYNVTLEACNIILKKYPFFCEKYPQMAQIMAGVLKDSVKQLRKTEKKDCSSLLLVASQCSKRIPDKIRYYLSKMGVYI